MSSLLLISLLALSLTSTPTVPNSLNIENTWTSMEPATSPFGRSRHAMAYDAQSDRVIMFGGDHGAGETSAYDFNTNTWTKMNPAAHPASLRADPAMAYDAESDRIILFGGYTTFYNDETWAYDFNTDTWTMMNPPTRPPARGGHAMAYDSESDRVILFGGETPSGWWTATDTWAYDFNTDTWTRMNPAAYPSGRLWVQMAYDAESDRVILFGGLPGVPSDETWAYDYNTDTWVMMNPVSRPSARAAHAMAYDEESDRVILFGGALFGTSFIRLDDTWAYDFNTNTWADITPASSPSARDAHAMAYDSESDRVILFGGDTGAGDPSRYSAETWAHHLTIVPSTLTVSIDIKPGSSPNSINPASRGKIPVAVLSTLTFNAPSQLDQTSLTFGRLGDEHSLAFCNPEDINQDGLPDLVCHFNTTLAAFQRGDTTGTLRGRTLDGTPVEGQDSVRLVP